MSWIANFSLSYVDQSEIFDSNLTRDVAGPHVDIRWDFVHMWESHDIDDMRHHVRITWHWWHETSCEDHMTCDMRSHKMQWSRHYKTLAESQTTWHRQLDSFMDPASSELLGELEYRWYETGWKDCQRLCTYRAKDSRYMQQSEAIEVISYTV